MAWFSDSESAIVAERAVGAAVIAAHAKSSNDHAVTLKRDRTRHKFFELTPQFLLSLAAIMSPAMQITPNTLFAKHIAVSIVRQYGMFPTDPSCWEACFGSVRNVAILPSSACWSCAWALLLDVAKQLRYGYSSGGIFLR